ncbi:hypothetical protein F5148DRAFT_1237059 [Russula earlei]|uniref:Uncharacterized protein n=1 Tax=Russula earlei TaxID=71964 RepID=A0ACC0TYI6_9AGAM|nr:hypothetical protein F5148DRAFT_1237059 [Russula earlei]
MGCATKNAKVITIALGALQRLIVLRAVSLSVIPAIIQTMNDCMSQGVDIQLKILQTLLSLITNFPAIHGRLLANALLLCFKLHDSRTAVVSSTAAATLRQLVMFVVDKVIEEDRRLLLANELESITLPDGTTQALGHAARDAFAIFEDLCLLGNGERPQFLQLEHLHKTFALELIESVLTNYQDLFRKHPELLLLLRHHLCPLLLKTLSFSERPSFPRTLRGTRVVFLLLKQFSAELATEAEVFLTLFIRLISGESEGWVLAMEIMRGLCGDADFVRSVWQRYDALAADDGTGSISSARVFITLISALKRLVTSRPSLLGVSAQMQGVGVHSSDSLPHSLDSVAGMMATAASATVSNVVGMIGSEAGLSLQSAAMKVQWAYIYLLGVQCLVSLSDGFAGYTIPLYNTLAVQKSPAGSAEPVRAPGPLDPSTLPATEPARVGLQTVRAMLNAGWPALLAALSFLLTTNLSDPLFGDVLGALQALARAAGCLSLPTPRDAFLTALAKAALPPRVVAALDEPAQAPPVGRSPVSLEGLTLGLAGGGGGATASQPPGLSHRNLACLRAFVAAALFLSGTLGPSWFADYVLTTRGTSLPGSVAVSIGAAASTPSKRGAPQAEGQPGIGQQQQQQQSQKQQATHPLLADVDPESVQAAIQRLFDASIMLEDSAFHDFVGALCKLSFEMVSMQSGADVGAGAGAGEGTLDVEDDNVPSASTSATSLVTPRTERWGRRRVSGIHIPRTLRSGDFGIARLGGVAAPNIQRLVYRSPDVAWDAITSHLLFVLRNPAVPQPIRLQSARTLDDILSVVPRHLAAAPSDLQASVQRRVLDVLAQQIMLNGTSSSTTMELRRFGLETLHQILQASGHTLLVGWETIFEVLGSVCRPAPSDIALLSTPSPPEVPRARPPPLGYLQEKGYSALIKIAFQCMTLMCDALSALSPDHLRLCISTLGQFGRQADTNIALTAAESLFWGVSDAIQAKRREADHEPEYSALWMHLLLEILRLCADARPDVRLGAIQTLFRTLQLYGATLSLDTWDECIWKVTFPLLDTLSPHVRRNALTPPLSPDASIASAEDWEAPTPDSSSSWDESKVVALQSIGAILNDFLMSKIIHLPSFGAAWETFVTHIRDAFLLDSRAISAPALRCLERALKATAATTALPAKVEAFRPSLIEIWEKTWAKCDEMGTVVIRRASVAPQHVHPHAPFTQESLVIFVDVIKSVRSISRALDGVEWPLQRIPTLMAILKGVLTYPNSPDFRPDIDNLSPVQDNVMDTINGIELTEAGVSSYILRDLSEYTTLAFIASFDAPQVHGHDAKPSTTVQLPVTKPPQRKRITYIALAKMCMSRLAELFLQFKEKEEIFVDGTVEAILSAYSVPIKLKYECPPPSNFGKDPPLWKTATTCCLKIIKQIGQQIDVLGPKLSPVRVESTWRQVIDVYRGGILADRSAADGFSLSEQEEEENFDLSLITSLETDVIPCLGDDRVPDYLITQLAKVLQQGSRLLQREADEDNPPTPSSHKQPSIKSTVRGRGSQADDEQVGSTEPVRTVSRERFSYWCLDLLFLICSDTLKDRDVSRRRVAALSLPALLGRCRTTLAEYVADEKIRGNLPFSRVREEELLYVLHKLRELRLWPGSLWAALSETPSKYATEQPAIDTSLPPSELIADAVKRSTRAHVFHFYTLLCEIASIPRKTPSAWITADRLVAAPGNEPAAGVHPGGRHAHASGPSSGAGSLVSLDARVLASECLKGVGRELGIPR